MGFQSIKNPATAISKSHISVPGLICSKSERKKVKQDPNYCCFYTKSVIHILSLWQQQQQLQQRPFNGL